MHSSILRRITSLASALVLLSATNAVPHHADADHTAEETHVDMEHGGHDGILIRDTDDRATGGKFVLRPELVSRLVPVPPSCKAIAHQDPANAPPLHPPDFHFRSRAPPPLI